MAKMCGLILNDKLSIDNYFKKLSIIVSGTMQNANTSIEKYMLIKFAPEVPFSNFSQNLPHAARFSYFGYL